MTVKVAYHKWHVVTGPAGGTVKSLDGTKTHCTIPENGDGHFYSTSTEVEVSDASIKVETIENFKNAPIKLKLMGLLGGGVSFALPKGYIAAEFLESTGTQFIITPFRVGGASSVRCVYYYTENKNATFAFGACDGYPVDMFRLARDYDQWCIQYATGKKYVSGDVGTKIDFRLKAGATTLNGTPIEVNYVDFETESPLYIFSASQNGVLFSWSHIMPGRIYLFELDETNSLIPAVDEKGVPCMYDKISKQQFRNSGKGQFIVGMTNKQALKLAELPAGGGELTVSLPWEAQLIASGVPDALQIAADKGWTIKVQYREAEADSALYNRYAECVTVDDVKAVNADYANDLTPAGEWIYPLPNLENANNSFSHDKGGKLITFRAALPKVTSISYMFGHKGTLEVFESCDMPSLINGYQAFIGNAKLTRFVYSMPALFNGGGMFSGCKLDKESVLVILNSIPAYTSGTHNITLGIHVDHETDEEVIAAIENAEAKGWLMTVQWNGTPTAQGASTFGLRRPAIYAKVGTMELPDGTTEQYLDWGHYVTNAEENGYQEFASVEEAKEYFNVEN